MSWLSLELRRCPSLVFCVFTSSLCAVDEPPMNRLASLSLCAVDEPPMNRSAPYVCLLHKNKNVFCHLVQLFLTVKTCPISVKKTCPFTFENNRILHYMIWIIFRLVPWRNSVHTESIMFRFIAVELLSLIYFSRLFSLLSALTSSVHTVSRCNVSLWVCGELFCSYSVAKLFKLFKKTLEVDHTV